MSNMPRQTEPNAGNGLLEDLVAAELVASHGGGHVAPVGAVVQVNVEVGVAEYRCRVAQGGPFDRGVGTLDGAALAGHDGGDLTALEGSKKLLDLDSVAVMNLKKGKGTLAGNDPVQPMFVKRLDGDRAREGEF